MAEECTVDAVVAKLGVLQLPFDYDAVYGQYQSPRASTELVRTDTQNAIAAAYEIAPEFFRERLCAVTKIFLDDRGPWGFRENPKQFTFDLKPAVMGRYIALPDAAPIGYGDYERAVMTNLLDWPPKRVVAADDSQALMMLAVLAHEDGHIFFKQIMAPNSEPIDPTRICGGHFWDGSWTAPVEIAPVKGVATYLGEHRTPPQIQDVVRTQNRAEAEDRLLELFRGRRWVSLLAAYSPEHDFVETYKALVLSRARTPVNHLTLFFPDRPSAGKELGIDLLSGLDDMSTEIGRKAACIRESQKGGP